MIKIEWDERKNQRNIKKHQIDFADAYPFFAELHVVWLDCRKDYNENRFVAIGEVHEKVLVTVFTLRAINAYRVISMRRANRNEQKIYRALQEGNEESN